jgi:uncharacterized membrane protein YhaH (DUF805 family)
MFKNPFSFNGRIRRTEYGLSMLIYLPFGIVANVMVADPSTVLIALILYVPCLWFLWAQGAKRCHDRGNSGFFMFIPFYVFWMLFAEGEQGPNDYGPDPKEKNKELINA